MTGHVQLQPQQQGGSLKSVLHSIANELLQIVKNIRRASLSEYCEYWRLNNKEALSPSRRWIELQKQKLRRKKIRYEVVSLPLKECKFLGIKIGKK